MESSTDTARPLFASSLPAKDTSAGAKLKTTLENRIGPLSWPLGGDGYVPRNDRSHYRLGLNIQAMGPLLARIGFLDEDRGSDSSAKRFEDASVIEKYRPYEAFQWKYVSGYRRSEQTAAWLDDVVGPIDSDPIYGLANVTGYDICDYVREWLGREGHQERSLCEVILLDDRFADLRPFVGRANVFFSHLQLEKFLGNASCSRDPEGLRACKRSETLYRLEQMLSDAADKFPSPSDQLVWMDYFSLRQAIDDFDPYAIVELVRDTGTVLANLDHDCKYFERSFCVLEIFAGATQARQLLCCRWARHVVQETLENHPINSAAAMAHKPKDKESIDLFIRETIGFAEFDRIVSDAVLAACQASVGSLASPSLTESALT